MPNWRLYYHVVWGTKNGLALIDTIWEKDLYDYIWGRAVTLDCIPYAIGGMPDHIHVVISIPPYLSIASLIVQLKLASSHHINEEYTNGSFGWQPEYGVLSVSETALPIVVLYVDNQKRHHLEDALHQHMENMVSNLPTY